MAARAQQVVVINGPAGAGKTTLGRALAATAPNGICIHGDALKRFVVSRAEPMTVETGLSYVGGAALAHVYLNAGYELVVFEFVFPTAAQVHRFEAALRARRADVDLRLVTLWADRQVVLARERARADQAGREPSAAQVGQCWRDMAGHLDDLEQLGPIVIADGPGDEILAEVLRILRSGSSARSDRS